MNLGFPTMLEITIVMTKTTMPFADLMVEIAAKEMLPRMVGIVTVMNVNA